MGYIKFDDGSFSRSRDMVGAKLTMPITCAVGDKLLLTISPKLRV